MLTKCASQIVLQFMYSLCEFKILPERYPRVPTLLRWLPNRHWTWNMGRYSTSSHADTYSFIYFVALSLLFFKPKHLAKRFEQNQLNMHPYRERERRCTYDALFQGLTLFWTWTSVGVSPGTSFVSTKHWR